MEDADGGTLIKVARLDWTEFEEKDLPEADVIVGSDLVYSAGANLFKCHACQTTKYC
jgi:hypothetical protein